MSCEGNVCGTGGWSGPLPGDPGNDINISAVPAFGGIDINWTYPTTNAFAIAYAIVYRGLTADFNGAIPLGQDTDGFYFDRVAPGRVYYYWVQAISINGTRGDVLGPASASAKSSIEQTMRDLTGLIDAGVLAQALRAQIERIPEIDLKVIKEIQDRITSHEALSAVIATLDSAVQGTLTLVRQEITERRDGDSALVTSINAIGAKVDANTAAIVTEQTVRASKDSAMATDITTLYTKTGDALAAVDTEKTSRTTADTALGQRIDSVITTVGQNTAAIQSETTARTTADSALSQRIDTLVTSVGNNAAAITSESTARTSADSALSTRIDTAQAKADSAFAAVQSETTARADAISSLATKVDTNQSTLGSQISQVQTTLQTNINAVDTKAGNAQTKANNIGALYTVKLNVNGLIGGFGTYNDGNTVTMGFDVDQFWVGRTNADKIKPFIIDSGVTYINEAAINKLTFSKLRSDDGSVVVANGKLKADYVDVTNLVATKVNLRSVMNNVTMTLADGLFQVTDNATGVNLIQLGVW